jgi:hypothetical protein
VHHRTQFFHEAYERRKAYRICLKAGYLPLQEIEPQPGNISPAPGLFIRFSKALAWLEPQYFHCWQY